MCFFNQSGLIQPNVFLEDSMGQLISNRWIFSSGNGFNQICSGASSANVVPKIW